MYDKYFRNWITQEKWDNVFLVFRNQIVFYMDGSKIDEGVRSGVYIITGMSYLKIHIITKSIVSILAASAIYILVFQLSIPLCYYSFSCVPDLFCFISKPPSSGWTVFALLVRYMNNSKITARFKNVYRKRSSTPMP